MITDEFDHIKTSSLNQISYSATLSHAEKKEKIMKAHIPNNILKVKERLATRVRVQVHEETLIETLYVDDEPVLKFMPVEIEHEENKDGYTVRITQRYQTLKTLS